MYKKYKLIRLNNKKHIVPLSNTHSIKFNNKKELIDTNVKKSIIDSDPTIVKSSSVLNGNNEFIQDKLLVGNEIMETTSTYRVVLDKKETKTKYMGIYDSKESAHKSLTQLTKDEELIKNSIEGTGGNYSYHVLTREIDIPNKNITLEVNSPREAIKMVLESLPNNSKVTNVTEKLKESFNAKHITGVTDTYDMANHLIDTLKGDSDNCDVTSAIIPIPNKDKDVLTTEESTINSMSKVNELLDGNHNNDQEEVIVKYSEYMEDKDVSLTPKKVPTKEDINKYLSELTSKGYNIISKSIKPLYITRKIDEIYDTEKDALTRKEDLETMYPSHIMLINKEHDITKDDINSDIDDVEYSTKEEAIKKGDSIKTDTTSYNIIEIKRLDTLTIDNELYSSNEQALNRVNEISAISVSGIPVHYSITKFDDSYYHLSMAYYQYVPYYQLEFINIKKGYKYHVIGEIPEINSYRIEVVAKEQVPRYKVTKTIRNKGYDYQYNVSYKKKEYTPTYEVSSVTPKYQLLIKGKGTYDISKTYNEIERTVTPVYRYDTRIQKVEEKRNSNTKVLEKVA